MAAITVVDPVPVLVDPYSVKLGKASANIAKGRPVVLDSAAAADPRYPGGSYKAAVAETTVHGITLKAAVAGQEIEVLAGQGEFEGFSGLTPGAGLTVAAGVLDSTAPAAGVDAQFIALTATRIWVRI